MNVGKGLSWPLGTPTEFVAYWEDIRRQLYATQEQRDTLIAKVEHLTRERDEARKMGIFHRSESLEAERDRLRALLAEARPIIAAHNAIAPPGDTLLMRVNAALEGRDG